MKLTSEPISHAKNNLKNAIDQKEFAKTCLSTRGPSHWHDAVNLGE